MPLCYANPGEESVIRKIGGSPEVKKHLENLGFVVGGTATVITSLNGNVIVKVKESRVAIDEEMARIMDERYQHVLSVLREHKQLLEYIANRLIEIETMDGKEFADIIKAEADLSQKLIAQNDAPADGNASEDKPEESAVQSETSEN